MTSTEGISAPTYDPTATLAAGRARYFDRYGFDEAGYAAEWVELNPIAGVPIRFPNTAQRVRSVKLHDLHHVLTGYAADWVGEAEISAWELAAGCAGHSAAWVLNTGAMAYGVLIAPRRTLRAFSRGRRCRTLYRMRELEPSLLDRQLGEVRHELGIDGADHEPTAGDVLIFGLAATAALAVSLSPFAVVATALSFLF